MNKVEFVSHVAAETSTTRADAEVMVGADFSTIADAFAQDESVAIAGFRKFAVRGRATRQEADTTMASKVSVPSCTRHQRVPRYGRTCLLALFGGALILGGCAQLPDIGPFADATSELTIAVASAGSAVNTELNALDGGEDRAKEFVKQWKAREQAMSGLLNYADSLHDIVRASNEADESFETLAENLKTLASTAGISLPATPSVYVANDLASFVFRQYALAKAAGSLEEALTAVQPAVEAIVDKLDNDLQDALKIFIAASTDAEQSLQTNEENQIRTAFRNYVITERDKLYQDPSNLSATKIARLKELDIALSTLGDWHEQLEFRRNVIVERRKAGQQLIDGAARGLKAWAITHKNMVIYVKSRRSVNIRSLTVATSELRTLIERIRAL